LPVHLGRFLHDHDHRQLGVAEGDLQNNWGVDEVSSKMAVAPQHASDSLVSSTP